MGRRNLFAQAAALACAAALAAPTDAVKAAARPDGAVLSKYCLTCHNDTRRVGGLSLAAKDLNHVGPDAEVWEKVVRKLRMGAMPPPGLPRPDNRTADSFVQALETGWTRKRPFTPTPAAPWPCTA